MYVAHKKIPEYIINLKRFKVSTICEYIKKINDNYGCFTLLLIGN